MMCEKMCCCHTAALKKKKPQMTEFSAKVCCGRFKPWQTGKSGKRTCFNDTNVAFQPYAYRSARCHSWRPGLPKWNCGQENPRKTGRQQAHKSPFGQSTTEQCWTQGKQKNFTFSCRLGWHSDIAKRLLTWYSKRLPCGLWQWRCFCLRLE